jgi:CheY-like chemotaxis protein
MAILLVVENEVDERQILVRLLTVKYQAVEAADFAEAIAQARLVRPDLVLLDLDLEGYLDGLEVCRALRSEADPQLARVPIVVLSGHSGEEIITAASTAGASSHLEKPYRWVTLFDLIDRLLALGKGQEDQN